MFSNCIYKNRVDFIKKILDDYGLWVGLPDIFWRDKRQIQSIFAVDRMQTSKIEDSPLKNQADASSELLHFPMDEVWMQKMIQITS